MRLRYLGTAAYEGIPSLFCQCAVCRHARENGGRDLRTRQQALVNDDLLLDFGPDTLAHTHRYGLDWDRIHDCLITHSHCDHFYPEDIGMCRPGFAAGICTKLHYYAGQAGYDRLQQIFARPEDGDLFAPIADATQIPLKAPFPVGQYTVLAVPANHDPSTSPVIYAISDGQKRLLYAHDTGWPCEESLAALAALSPFDLVSLDCCAGALTGWMDGHLGFDTCLRLADEMRRRGLATDATTFVVSHFSHNSRATHDDLIAMAAPHGIRVAYDGMEIEF